ncbi:Uncharacterized protein APZ42_005075, partial [Daphnia magna]
SEKKKKKPNTPYDAQTNGSHAPYLTPRKHRTDKGQRRTKKKVGAKRLPSAHILKTNLATRCHL